jgi:hypothetical protein
MSARVLVSIFVLLAVFFLPAFLMAAQNTPDLTGRWGCYFSEGGRPGAYITLFASRDEPRPWAGLDLSGLSGTYQNDTGDVCPVQGTVIGGSLDITVTCFRYEIKMSGQVQSDDPNIILGSYQLGAYVGKLRMEKYTCFLPEGCKQ